LRPTAVIAGTCFGLSKQARKLVKEINEAAPITGNEQWNNNTAMIQNDSKTVLSVSYGMLSLIYCVSKISKTSKKVLHQRNDLLECGHG